MSVTPVPFGTLGQRQVHLTTSSKIFSEIYDNSGRTEVSPFVPEPG